MKIVKYKDDELSIPVREESIICLLTLLDQWAKEIPSSDVAFIVINAAKIRCKDMGIDPELCDKIFDGYEDYAKKARQKNPMSCMY